MKTIKLVALAVVGCASLISCKDNNTTSKTTESKEIVANATPEKPEIATLSIEGMTCSMGCAKTIEKKLASTPGIQEAKVDFETKTATVNFDAAVLKQEKITEIVEATADGKTYKVVDIKVKA
jgi:mercuric ion binding protein